MLEKQFIARVVRRPVVEVHLGWKQGLDFTASTAMRDVEPTLVVRLFIRSRKLNDSLLTYFPGQEFARAMGGDATDLLGVRLALSALTADNVDARQIQIMLVPQGRDVNGDQEARLFGGETALFGQAAVRCRFW